MLAVSSSERKWNCSRCTFEQSPYNDECQICGVKNENVIKPSEKDDVININNNNDNDNKNIPPSIMDNANNVNQQKYGSIIYQIDRLTNDQLTASYTLFLQNSNIATSNWPVYLFGDNDIDNSRPPNNDREMMGGQGMN